MQQDGDTDDDGDVDNRDSEFRTINTRVTWLPYYDEASDGRYLVYVGGALRHAEDEPENLRFRARPEVHDTFRFLGVDTGPVDGYQQYGLEAAAVWGSFSVQGEWILTDVNNAQDSNLDGGTDFASYFLTGEHRSYRKSSGTFHRVTPLENFWWVDSDNPHCRFGLGAW